MVATQMDEYHQQRRDIRGFQRLTQMRGIAYQGLKGLFVVQTSHLSAAASSLNCTPDLQVSSAIQPLAAGGARIPEERRSTIGNSN
jgi:hypothetical protein